MFCHSRNCGESGHTKRLQNEVDHVLENNSEQAPYEAVNGMEYLISNIYIYLSSNQWDSQDIPRWSGIRQIICNKFWITSNITRDIVYYKRKHKTYLYRFMDIIMLNGKNTISTAELILCLSWVSRCVYVTDSHCWKQKFCCFTCLYVANCKFAKTSLSLKLAKDGGWRRLLTK